MYLDQGDMKSAAAEVDVLPGTAVKEP